MHQLLPLCPTVDLSMGFPLAARAVEDSFYVDDGLTGADSIEEAINSQGLFDRGGFLLRKWNSRELEVLLHILRTELSTYDL